MPQPQALPHRRARARGRRAACLALVLAAVVGRAARADGIDASVDRAETTVEEPITLSVHVDGSQSAEPTLPDLPDFEVHRQGRATQVQIINGHLSTGATYTYVMAPRHAGTFTVGPISVSLGGRSYASAAFAVRVAGPAPLPPGVAGPGAAGQGSTPPGGAGAGGAGGAEAAGTAPLFVVAEVQPTQLVVGQQAIYTWRFFRRQRIGNAHVTLPGFEGLLAEQLGEQREYDTHLGGVAYHVVEMRRALFAQEPGTVHVEGSSLQCETFGEARGGSAGLFPGGPFDALFGQGPRQTRTLRSPPLTLTVAPLPPAPPGYTGLVGQFHAEAELSAHAVPLGESVTYTVRLTGTGNLGHMAEISFPEVVGLKAYDDRPTLERNDRGAALAGTKIYRRALVPTQAGTLTVPPLHIATFDPAQGRFVDVATAALLLTVAPGADGRTRTGPGAVPAPGGAGSAGRPGAGPPATAPAPAPAPAQKVEVAVLADDILPSYDRIDALYPQRIDSLRLLLWLGSLGAAWLLYAGLAVALARRGDGRAGAGRRRRGALREAMRAARALEPLLRAGQVPQAATAGSRALRAYLGQRLAVEGYAMTADEARTRLLARGCSTELAAAAENFLRRCEGAQYSFAPGTVSLYTSLADELRGLLGQLDRRLRQ